MRLASKVALVTGGGSGIGRGIAIRFAEEGADVAVADLNREGSEETAAEVVRLDAKALAIEGDVTSKSDCERMVEETVASFGKLDIFVANAGIGRAAPLLDVTEEDWNAVINTNLTGVFMSCQAAARQMVSQGHGGRIICTASLAAIRPSPFMPAYHAAKAGVKMLAEVLAIELASQRITVNAIAPGIIDTPLTSPLIQAIESSGRQPAPLGRLGQPVDIANGALFLASDEAQYVTGHLLVIDGGLGLRGLGQ
jgi:NAD(P)-dependent dehydrogenase (short-subunit alcohol dehydrogenase family)